MGDYEGTNNALDWSLMMITRTVLASLLVPVFALTLTSAALGSSGGDGDGGGGDEGIRVVLLQAGGEGTTVSFLQSTTGPTSGSQYLGFSAEAGQSITFGLDVLGAADLINYEIIGDNSLTHHPIGTTTYQEYTGNGLIDLVVGGHQLSFTGPGGVVLRWNDPVDSGSDPYLTIPNFTLENGTISYHPAGEQQWLWFHGSAGDTSTIGLQAVGGDVEASLVWVGNVSADFALPDEASDQSGVSLTGGVDYTVSLDDATGIFGIRLGDGGGSDGDDGGSSGGSCAGDLNNDNLVNGADLALLLGSWGVCGE
ncbi:MAG: hypothetical protein VX641_02655 [Planctomycetota bacterium]|nr:hypothetical protein [Planctomycetota bacterium]